jgi:hypothetical protein
MFVLGSLLGENRASRGHPISRDNAKYPNGYDPHPNSRMGNDGISDYSGNDWHHDNPDSGELRMTAQIIQFRDYQNPCDLAPMHGDIETSLAKLNHMAAEVFNALMFDTAAAEYSANQKDPA